MFLLVGSPDDLCCARVEDALRARGLTTRVVANPLAHPSRFSWRLDGNQSRSELVWDATARDDTIDGVLVRGAGWVDPAGWESADLAYMQAETQAALVGWLWSLACPVVNRYPAAVWYRPHLPVACWRPLLRRGGLLTPSLVVSNVEGETRAFGSRLAARGAPGAVYTPLTSDTEYLVGTDHDWAGLAGLQRRTPVCLTCPHEEPKLLCIVGESVVWEGGPPDGAAALESALTAFARDAGLAFVEMATARTPEGVRVISVEHHPHFEHFGDVAQARITERLCELLTSGCSN